MHVMAAFLLLAGCSGEKERNASQVVAVVGDEEITAPMLESELARLQDPASRRNPLVQKTVTERLISQTLFAQRAQALDLDQTPAVAREVESARRAVLAKAYLDSIKTGGPPAETEIAAFYRANPTLFADRRDYVLTEVAVRSDPADIQPFVEMFKSGNGDAGSLATRLQADGVAAAPTTLTIPSDRLPEPLARRLASMKAGDRITYRTGDVQHFLWVAASRPSPVPLALAHDTISGFLADKHVAAVADRAAKTMRAETQVEYGDVGKTILAGATKSGAAEAAPAPSRKIAADTVQRGAAGL
jgi:EpsD family peptidyl-prolyl cis-trans isomerase